MTAPSPLAAVAGLRGRVRVRWPNGRRLDRTCGLADRVGECEQVVLAGLRVDGLGRQPQHLPAPRGREAFAVEVTEVVGVRLGVRRQRPEHRGLVGVHIGQRRHRGTVACGAGTTPGQTHAADGTGPARTWRIGSLIVQPADPSDGADRHRLGRDRRGRGMRGPAVLPLIPGHRPPRPRTEREVFDRLVLDVVAEIDDRWSERLGLIEYAVEDTPQLPDDWDSGTIPLSSLVRGTGGRPTRLVVFRRPLERRALDRADLGAMVLTVIVEQISDLLGIPPTEVDPRYPDA